MSLFETMPQGLPSKFEILTDTSLFCTNNWRRNGRLMTEQDAEFRIPQGLSTAWQSVDVRSRDDTSVECFNLDVFKVVAVRYAWQGACCDDRPATLDEKSCRVMLSTAFCVSANPFGHAIPIAENVNVCTANFVMDKKYFRNNL